MLLMMPVVMVRMVDNLAKAQELTTGDDDNHGVDDVDDDENGDIDDVDGDGDDGDNVDDGDDQGSLLIPKIEFFINADMRGWNFL